MRKNTFDVATFGGSIFPEGRYSWNLLTPVKFCLCFRRVAIFGGLSCFGNVLYTVLKIKHEGGYLLLMPVKIPDGDFEGRLKQSRSQGSLLPVPLPVPTERERETGRRENLG